MWNVSYVRKQLKVDEMFILLRNYYLQKNKQKAGTFYAISAGSSADDRFDELFRILIHCFDSFLEHRNKSIDPHNDVQMLG